jgi:hypothetical protein
MVDMFFIIYNELLSNLGLGERMRLLGQESHVPNVFLLPAKKWVHTCVKIWVLERKSANLACPAGAGSPTLHLFV